MNVRTLKPKIEKKLNSPSDLLRLEATRAPRDHFMYSLYFKEKKIGIFQISMGSHEFRNHLIGMMSRQLGISSQNLKDLERCVFWGKDFVENSRLIQGQ